MILFVLRRIGFAIPTFFLIVTAAFFMMHGAPGGPFDLATPMTPEARAHLERAYGLDQPIWRQYAHYMQSLLHGDLGPSLRSREFTVAELIAAGLPVSLQLGLMALSITVAVGVPVGFWQALRRGTAADSLISLASAFLVVAPTFVVAPILGLVFGVYLGWLPVTGWNHGDLYHAFLPSLCLSLPYVGFVIRLTRTRGAEVLATSYVRTAIAKGLPTRAVIRRHALPPTLMPVVSFLGPAMAGIIVTSVVVEQVFAVPGMGSYFVDAAMNRDYTLVMGIVIVYAALLLTMNIAVDVLYAYLDPRLRTARELS